MAVEPDSAGVRFPPPFVYLGALLLGLAADRFVTLRSFGIDWRLLGIPPPKAALRHQPGAVDLNGACKSAAKIRGSQSDGDHHRS